MFHGCYTAGQLDCFTILNFIDNIKDRLTLKKLNLFDLVHQQ